jgi:hypothetical protein
MKIDPKQIAKMITEDPNEINPLDDIEDMYFPSQQGIRFVLCPECGREITDEDDMAYCDAGHFPDPVTGTYCHNKICKISCLDVHKTGMSPSGWFTDVDMGEWYCPDHAAEAQQERFDRG